MKPIVQVENLGKQYSIGGHASHSNMRETIVGFIKSPLEHVRRQTSVGKFWALKDLSFEIEAGEVVGIIGHNGAGKSTLLKILSRIVQPTKGSAKIYGRVGSLLEVGTGFHPELTGRENIFLNGAILGMKRAEIVQKFDEIVAFSEIEKFIDTPVKWYSSGMYLRLAFAVAVHLDPEILIMDEVLAVGDDSFQQKCMNKMQEIRQNGRTILFVSHNIQSVTRLCSRAILISEGRIINDGPSYQIASAYLNSTAKISGQQEWPDLNSAPGNEIVRLRSVRVCTDDQSGVDAIDIRKPVGIQMEYEVLTPGAVLVPNYHFFNEEGVYVCVVHDCDPEWRNRPRPTGFYSSIAWIPGNFLSEGTLRVGAAISTHNPIVVHCYEPEAVAFQVIDSLDGDSARGDFTERMPGVVRPLLHWVTQHTPVVQTNPF